MTTESPGVRVAVTVTEPVPVIAGPDGGVPVAVAVFAILPASTSAWVAAYEPVHEMLASIARVATGIVGVQLSVPTFGSDTDTFVSATFPVFFAVIV